MKAKSVIWLFMNGGQSQVETWNYKPPLEKYDGKPLAGFDQKTGFFPAEVGALMKSPFAFQQYGKSGTWASELFPRTVAHVDDMAFIHSCFTATNNHSPAQKGAKPGRDHNPHAFHHLARGRRREGRRALRGNR